MNEITEEQFYLVYNKHLPNKWIKFAYKYFSKETENKNIVLSKTVTSMLFALLLIGLAGTIFELQQLFINIFSITFLIMMFVLTLYLFSAVKLNNLRIKRICEELNIKVEEFSVLAMKFNL